jgi:hypothetical protein
MFKQTAAAILATALVAASAQAAFVKVDDFELRTTGQSVIGQGGWQQAAVGTVSGSANVVVDPTDSGNQVLALINSSNGGASLGLGAQSVTSGTGTLFFRLRADAGDPDATPDPIPSGQNYWSGLGSDSDGAFDGWNDGRAYLTVSAAQALRARDGSSDKDVPVDGARSIDMDTWYNVWIVADAGASTYDIHIQGGSSDFASQSQIVDDFAWRVTSGPLDVVAVWGNAGGSGTMYYDDIYVDTAGENLAVVPEPATVGVLLIGATGFLSRRRRK